MQNPCLMLGTLGCQANPDLLIRCLGPLGRHATHYQMPGTPVVAGQILISLAFLGHFPPQAIAWLNTNTDKKTSAVAE